MKARTIPGCYAPAFIAGKVDCDGRGCGRHFQSHPNKIELLRSLE